MQNSLMQTYARKNVTFTHGDGAWLYDQQGNRYLDMLGGIAVCGLGHAHPAVANTICAQSKKLLHTSNIYRIEQQEQLGEKLCKLGRMEKAFFCNSGAEANEAAIKLARLYGHSCNIDTPTIIVFENSFHGRTLATLTATGNRKAQSGFEPLVEGFIRAPYNDSEFVENLCAENNSVCAILVEPIQGEGGIRIAEQNFLNRLRSICDRHQLLLIFDEIQTGVGRTGHWYAADYFNVRPDIMTTAKALGNGIPIGACLATGTAASLFTPGLHGTTFGGNPLACATALTVLNTIESTQLFHQIQQNSAYFLSHLREQLQPLEIVKEIRGIGFMLGIELMSGCAGIVDLALSKGLLVNVTAENVIRLLPPYIITREQLELAAHQLKQCITEFADQHAQEE